VLHPGSDADYDEAHERIPDELIEAHRRVGIHDWRIWRSACRRWPSSGWSWRGLGLAKEDLAKIGSFCVLSRSVSVKLSFLARIIGSLVLAEPV